MTRAFFTACLVFATASSATEKLYEDYEIENIYTSKQRVYGQSTAVAIRAGLEAENDLYDFKQNFDDHMELFENIAETTNDLLELAGKNGLIDMLSSSSKFLGKLGAAAGPVGGAVSIICGIITGFQDSDEMKGIAKIQKTVDKMHKS